ncbi:MAG: ZIP family metal transporter [Betaproteobacteria bacterium]|nr:MAG: ZIP family metal transporter [Betaproteobacteria bacterium]
MSTLAWISAASLLGGVLSVACAALFVLTARAAWVPMLVSYAIGALLGAAFLELLPHALEGAASARSVAATVLGGILVFFVLEKLVLWRHCHVEDCEVHDQRADAHDHGRSGMLILIGDSFHNFVDGILIAAAFMQDTQLGIVTALAVIAHEIPQEVGDFLILLHSGYSRMRAFMLNLASSFAMFAGGLLGYYALQTLQEWVQSIVALAAASMVYVAVADLIPGLHQRPELKATLSQSLLIALGVGSIWLVGYLTRNYTA